MKRPSVIIGIHGLANKPPADEKTCWWKVAIAEGLARNEGLADAAFAFAFVYWADLRYGTPLASDAMDEPYRLHEGTGPLPSEEDAPKLTGPDVLVAVYEGIDRIEEATGLTLVDDVILEHRFDDLWHYHVEREFAQQVRARLIERLQQFRDHRILLMAHSMGSVIAYDVLRLLERDDPSLQVEHLVTVGSPLGLAKVKLKIEAECGAARVPNNVGHWTNLADGNDIVAVTGALASDYAPSDTCVQVTDHRVVNDYCRPTGQANHHKSYGYLRTPEFSRIAARFVSPAASSGSAVPEGQRRRGGSAPHSLRLAE
jgi:pimeloyl-ACP methyl ester carboxylesterase